MNRKKMVQEKKEVTLLQQLRRDQMITHMLLVATFILVFVSGIFSVAALTALRGMQ